MPRDDVRDDASSSQRTSRDANTEGYDPKTPAMWPGGVDPGTVKDALDVMATAGAMDPVNAARVFDRKTTPTSEPNLLQQATLIRGPRPSTEEADLSRLRSLIRPPAAQPEGTREFSKPTREVEPGNGQAILAMRVFA